MKDKAENKKQQYAQIIFISWIKFSFLLIKPFDKLMAKGIYLSITQRINATVPFF